MAIRQPISKPAYDPLPRPRPEVAARCTIPNFLLAHARTGFDSRTGHYPLTGCVTPLKSDAAVTAATPVRGPVRSDNEQYRR